MEERSSRFRFDYIPNLYQEGPLKMSASNGYNSGNLNGRLTTHNLILPRPNEIRTIGVKADKEMGEHMPWMARQCHLQGRVDHILWQTMKDRGSSCNHGHLVIPDYIVPGYTGCLHRNPMYTGSIFKRCCPNASYDYDIIQNTKPYESQNVSCKQITPIVPSLRLCMGRKEWT